MKALPLETQAILLLYRLRKLYWDHKAQPQKFFKGNFLCRSASMLDPESLATNFPEGQIAVVIDHLLGAPWLYLEQRFYITNRAGDGWFEITQQGFERTNDDVNAASPDQNVLDALPLLHQDLRDYGHYFREHKLKDAVAAAFRRVENRLNEIRDSSGNSALCAYSGSVLPRKLLDCEVLKFPYPDLASGNKSSHDAYITELKNLLSSGIGWFRNSFQHEPHNLPDFSQAETLEHLFVASYLLHLIDRRS